MGVTAGRLTVAGYGGGDVPGAAARNTKNKPHTTHSQHPHNPHDQHNTPTTNTQMPEVVREVGLLVYDEVHYLRDAERGVVWEESIALAPRGCRMAFLSATLPNAAEFAGWVAATHGSPCHVVYTDYRPTPLQHFIYPAGEREGAERVRRECGECGGKR